MTILRPRVLNLPPGEPPPHLLDLTPGERLRHILHVVQDEATRTEAKGSDTAEGHWDQSRWGSFSPRGLTTAGVDLDALTVVEQHPGTTDNGPGIVTTLALPAFVPENACGSACCFAGHAVLRAGDTPLVQVQLHSGETVGGTGLPEGELVMEEVLTPDGQRMRVSDRARELLGLSMAQADVLFDCQNTIDDLLQLVPRLIDGETPERCRHCDRWTWNCERGGVVCDECGFHTEVCYCGDNGEDYDDAALKTRTAPVHPARNDSELPVSRTWSSAVPPAALAGCGLSRE